MPTDNHSLDQFFRDKNAELPAETGRTDEHWKQMQALLNQEQVAGVHKPAPLRSSRKYWAAAALIPLLAILSFLSYRYFNHRSYDPQTIPALARQLPAPAKPAPVINQDSLRNPANLDSFLANWKMPVININFAWQHWPPVFGLPTSTYHYPLPLKMEELLLPPGVALASWYKDIEKKPDIFSIPFDKDTLITCREGTEIIIPAHAFARMDGSPVKANVDLKVEEYYKPSDMVAARLATRSGGGLLSTAGMLLIRAFLAGEELKLAPQKNLLVRMPADDYDDKMQLFIPAADTLKLQPADSIRLQQPDSMNDRLSGDTLENISLSLKNVVTDLFSSPANWMPNGQPQQRWWYRPQVTLPGTDRYQQLRGPDGETDGPVVTFIVKPGVSKAEIRKELENRYMSGVKIKLRRASRRQMKTFEFPGQRIDFAEAFRRGLISREDSIRFAGMVKIYNSPEQSAPRFEDRYSFSLSSLGWINCDKFLEDARPKTDMLFETKSDGGIYIPMLVFPRLKSVLRGYYDPARKSIVFNQLPVGELAWLVCVGETTTGAIVGCMQETTVTGIPQPLPPLSAIEPAAFKAQTANLDKK